MKRKTKKPENAPKLELQTKKCMLCRLNQKDHSEKLWKMHNATVEMALSKTYHKKLWTMQIGFGPKCAAYLDDAFEKEIVVSSHQTGDAWRWNVVPTNLNPQEWLRPIYMSCSSCGLFLGKTEEEYADMLDGMCLKCFRELIGQTAYWYDMPPATKILKEGVKTRMYRDSKGKWHKLYGNFTNAHHCGEVSR